MRPTNIFYAKIPLDIILSFSTYFALRYPFSIPKIQYCDLFSLEYTTEVVIDCRDHRIRLVSSYCCFE